MIDLDRAEISHGSAPWAGTSSALLLATAIGVLLMLFSPAIAALWAACVTAAWISMPPSGPRVLVERGVLAISLDGRTQTLRLDACGPIVPDGHRLRVGDRVFDLTPNDRETVERFATVAEAMRQDAVSRREGAPDGRLAHLRSARHD